MKLKREIYEMRAYELAPYLLGKVLCRKTEDGVLRARICETECYFGESDSACHAHKGKTPRTKTLYKKGGIAYVYLCYGIHSLINVVSGEEDFPEAVLIRGVDGAQGPGRVTKFMKIDRSLNEVSFVDSEELWIEDDGYVVTYSTDKRVGIDYADDMDRERKWRFILNAPKK